MASFAQTHTKATSQVIQETTEITYRSVQVTSYYRSFCAILDLEENEEEETSTNNQISHNGVELVRNGVIGRLEPFDTPFGTRPIVYADWTASGRAHKAVEEYLKLEVLPFYGNTHTTTSITGSQSTCFRHEARQTVAEAVNAKITGRAAQDVVLFSGAGTTSVVSKLVRILGLHLPNPGNVEELMNDNLRPVIFVGPMEHHSNLLPWRECAALVVQIQLSEDGTLDVNHLEEELKIHKDAPLKIGSFSAASNVSGLVEQIELVTKILHHYHALSFWDYAAAAPYIHIDMNPPESSDVALSRFNGSVAKDAVFFSPHKFVGGIGAPGVLIVKKRLLENKVPSNPGGGTVFYVTSNSHRYLSNREEREEGGTPDIVGTCRCALAFNLKRWSGPSILECHRINLRKAHEAFLQCPNLVVLASGAERFDPLKRLPTFSFLIRWAAGLEDHKGRWLHYNFVGALLNDLFGIQSRGGCQCAGPYGQQLLGITEESAQKLENCLMEEKAELLRPGFSRLSLPYTMSPTEVDFVLQAMIFVSHHGWKFLPLYRFDYKTGECKHRSRATKFPERRWLNKFNIEAESSISEIDPKNKTWSKLTESELAIQFQELLKQAQELSERTMEKQHGRVLSNQDHGLMLEGKPEEIRWFVYPSEVSEVLKSTSSSTSTSSKDWDAMEEAMGPLQPQSLKLNNCRHIPSAEKPPPIVDTSDVLSEDSPLPIGKIKYPYRSAHSDLLEPPLWAQSEIVKKMFPPPVNTVHNDSEKSSSSSSSIPVKSTPPTTSTSTKKVEKIAEKFHGVLLPSSLSSLSPPEMTQIDQTTAMHSTENTLAVPITETTMAGVKQPKLPVPPKKMMRPIGQAIRDWKMIQDNDRIVVGLSGGKDSLSLLCALVDLQRRAPVKFELAAVTIDPMTPSFDPSPLKQYLKRFGIPYHYLANPIIDRAASGQLQGDSLCAFCSRMKRGLLYRCCRENGYNKLVLGQHLDDLAESFIMSSLHNGQVRTMKANYKIEAGDVSVIRPLIYVREHQTKEFAKKAGLPIINENCPACFEEPKERHRVKKMLAREEALAPEIFPNIKSALLPLMAEGVYPYMDLLRNQVAINETTNTKQTRGMSIKKGDAGGGERGAPGGEHDSNSATSDDVENHQKPEEQSKTVQVSAESIKWSSDCLSVIPDSWLEAELKRRQGLKQPTMPTLSIQDESESVIAQSRVKLCNTGKCEMFD